MTLTPEQIKAGWTPWHGGDKAPDDWDGGEVLFRNGDTPNYGRVEWTWVHNNCGGDIIGYRRKSPDKSPSPELVERMVEVVLAVKEGCASSVEDEARAILAELEPVDPLVDLLDTISNETYRTIEDEAAAWRAELAKRGLTITKAGEQ